MRLPHNLLGLACVLALGTTAAKAQWTAMNPVTSVQKASDGVVLPQGTGYLKLQVCSDTVVRIQYSRTATFKPFADAVITKTSWPSVDWKLTEKDDQIILSTAKLKVVVERKNGSIFYQDASGKPILNEESRKLTPVRVNGEDTYKAESFMNIYGSTEGLYGLGQHQAGTWNYRGADVELAQDNTNISVPLLVSSKGYGIYWNNTSRSRVNNRFTHYLYLSSEVADVLDYYFIYGPELDSVVAGYRELTGDAPLFGKWAYGFWQCKNRYRTQEELLDVAKKYRDLHIPADNIVQDWFWWDRKGEHVFNKNYPDPKGMVDQLHKDNFHLMLSVWPFFEPGSKEYEEMDKNGWFVEKFKYAKPPYHHDAMAVYDATNPAARKFYWQIMDKNLFTKLGIDAWWMDTTEPETEGQQDNILLGHKLAMGSADRVVNLYPLLTTGGVYEGQRSVSDEKRVFILSRSAFAGSQRNSVAAWSGDINSDWFSYRRQVPAALNFALSGIPYWTMDIGGFLPRSVSDPAYRELFTRWFQFGTFCPIMRVHGGRIEDQNELWSYGPETQKILVDYDRLRYRMLPYIYSLAWKTTHERYTIQRPLVMDFQNDVRAEDTSDQYMFGPAFLVSPVLEPEATTRHLYLPKATWVDFWTGDVQKGGRTLDAAAPIDRMPLFVKAGSILPLGPEIEWASQKTADPIELRVYRGADGAFTLYEDEGDSYRYEKGAYATIPLSWDEATQTLTLGERKGSFKGMLQERTFHVVFVGKGHGAGINVEAKADKVVKYTGKTVTVKP